MLWTPVVRVYLVFIVLSTFLIKNTAWSFAVKKESSADCFLNFLLSEKLLRNIFALKIKKKHLHFHIYQKYVLFNFDASE